MTSLRETARRLFAPPQPLPPGTYHYQAPPDDERNFRLHLRIEPGGQGLLIVNAATILHLNTTATEYAYHLIQGTPLKKMAQELSRRYRVSHEQARYDFQLFTDRIYTLIETPDLDPELFLNLERILPHSEDITAPYRLDCAITYQLPKGASSEAAPTRSVDRELTTDEWRQILDKSWKAGIPHIVFTGGEPTLRPDLPELIAHAESNGQITGLLSDGYTLADQAYLDELLQTGLDHLTMVLKPKMDETIRKALENVLAADLFVATHLTLTAENSHEIQDLIERLAQMGVKAISLSATNADLLEELEAAYDLIASKGLSLVWDLPVPYSEIHPVALETVDEKNLPGAGRAWLYVEPDGDVLPAQGIERVMGNFLQHSWDLIWKRE